MDKISGTPSAFHVRSLPPIKEIKESLDISCGENQEMHHRIRNNLSNISTLAPSSLTSGYGSLEEDRPVFQETIECEPLGESSESKPHILFVEKSEGSQESISKSSSHQTSQSLAETIGSLESISFGSRINFCPREFSLTLERPLVLSWFANFLYKFCLRMEFVEAWRITRALRSLQTLQKKTPYVLNLNDSKRLFETGNVIVDMIISFEALRMREIKVVSEFMPQLRETIESLREMEKRKAQFIKTFYALQMQLLRMKKDNRLPLLKTWFQKFDVFDPEKENYFYPIGNLANILVLFYEDEKNQDKLPIDNFQDHQHLVRRAKKVRQQAIDMWLMLPLIKFKNDAKSETILQELDHPDTIWTYDQAMNQGLRMKIFTP